MMTIVDFGAGNVGSIANMARRAGLEVQVGSTTQAVLNAKRLILPGVGAFDSVMTRFSASGLAETVLGRHRVGVPILGICVGMQMLSEGSDEGVVPGLALLAGRTRTLRSIIVDQKARVPHMGWAGLRLRRSTHLLESLPPESRFYFVHSYAMVCDDERDCIASIDYGGSTDITAAVQRENLFGVQFHPEKSRHFGMALLRNFAAVS
jgi:imidazole glycerol-phosphate synthase subunit HisH